MKICTSCHFPNEDNAFFCENCGNPEFEPSGGKKEEPVFAPAGKKCTQCGAIIEDGASFCDECGCPVGSTKPTPEPPGHPEPSGPVFNCLFCGKPLAPGQDICSCGTKKGDFLPSNKKPGGGNPKPPIPGGGNPKPPIPGGGTPNPPIPGGGTPKPPIPGGAKIVIIICAVLIVAALAFIAYILFGNGFDFGSKKSNEPNDTTGYTEINDEPNYPEPYQPYEPVETEPETEIYSYTEPENTVPYELERYADGLVPENRYYTATLQEADWNVNYRSSPELIDKKDPRSNVVGKLICGTEVYAEYIYNDVWLVFKIDGQYCFSSIYASGNPNANRLFTPSDEVGGYGGAD